MMMMMEEEEEENQQPKENEEGGEGTNQLLVPLDGLCSTLPTMCAYLYNQHGFPFFGAEKFFKSHIFIYSSGQLSEPKCWVYQSYMFEMYSTGPQNI